MVALKKDDNIPTLAYLFAYFPMLFQLGISNFFPVTVHESFHVFFNFWIEPVSKNINFLITPGCLWLLVVLCSCPLVHVSSFLESIFLCCHNLEKLYHLSIMPCVFPTCCTVDPFFLVLDACKGPTHDRLNIGLVSYQVPFAAWQSRWKSTAAQKFISEQRRLNVIQCTCTHVQSFLMYQT